MTVVSRSEREWQITPLMLKVVQSGPRSPIDVVREAILENDVPLEHLVPGIMKLFPDIHQVVIGKTINVLRIELALNKDVWLSSKVVTIRGVSLPETVRQTLKGARLSAAIDHPLIPENAIITDVTETGTIQTPKTCFYYEADAISLSACFPEWPAIHKTADARVFIRSQTYNA